MQRKFAALLGFFMFLALFGLSLVRQELPWWLTVGAAALVGGMLAALFLAIDKRSRQNRSRGDLKRYARSGATCQTSAATYVAQRSVPRSTPNDGRSTIH